MVYKIIYIYNVHSAPCAGLNLVDILYNIIFSSKLILDQQNSQLIIKSPRKQNFIPIIKSHFLISTNYRL